MKNTRQQGNWISRMRLVGTCSALAFVAVLALAVITTESAQAQTFTSLASFNGTDGANPYAGVVQAINGDFYGVTLYGGIHNSGGTVFKMTPSGTVSTVYNFCAQTGCADGANPYAALLQAANGSFYGTTASGGAGASGIVFKITPSGALTILNSFDNTYGEQPEAALIQAPNGDFYGTATEAGFNAGTIFDVTPSGTLTLLHDFCSVTQCADGEVPHGALVFASNGNLYGTTGSGGAHFDGTVFSMTPSGTLTTLYAFCSLSDCTDGSDPFTTLIQATNGDFYGTTQSGGANGFGTVFKMTSTGALTVLYNFCSLSGCADGEDPIGALVQATDGNFYGTTARGGANGDGGTIFKLTPTGTLTTLYSFCSQPGCADGSTSYGGIIQGTDGDFYGTTSVGGVNPSSYGTVFSLSVGLRPFVETLPSSGKVGAKVTILGSNLTGATGVSFNGRVATFTVVSESEITTTVPTGATTGTVEVTTPRGTLKSNTKFRVTP
jgi:uncharacterized repeat protein (TIGR03803 family)